MLRKSLERRVLTLTLDRPDKRNALNLALCRALVDAVEAAWRDDAVGAVLIEGEGKSFCAGMDLSEMLAYGEDTRDLSHIHEKLFTLGARSPKPLIAAVQGAALAGGTGLTANAHIVVAAEDASFGLTEIRIGLWPFVIYRAVEAAIGPRRTLALSLNGRIFTAHEALSFGLVHHVARDEELRASAREVATRVAESSPDAIRAGMSFVAETRGKSSEESAPSAWRCREDLFRCADFREGITAFHEKRAPRWPSLSRVE